MYVFYTGFIVTRAIFNWMFGTTLATLLVTNMIVKFIVKVCGFTCTVQLNLISVKSLILAQIPLMGLHGLLFLI